VAYVDQDMISWYNASLPVTSDAFNRAPICKHLSCVRT